MLNKVMIIGRLGSDPDLRYSQSGMPVANFNVATDESYVGKDGQRAEKTEWHRIVVFQRAAENCKNYLRKGSLVYIEGSLQTRKWQDQQGQDRYTTEIKAQRVQFLDRKGDGQGGAQGGGGYGEAQRGHGQGGRNAGAAAQQGYNPMNDDMDMGPAFPSEAGMSSAVTDEVPF